MITAAQAVAKKKLRVYWDAPEPPSAPPRDAMLDGIYAALREQHAAPATSQDERVEISAVTANDDGTFLVRLRYTFDRDFASQYDERESFDGEVVVDGKGALVSVPHWTSSTAS